MMPAILSNRAAREHPARLAGDVPREERCLPFHVQRKKRGNNPAVAKSASKVGMRGVRLHTSIEVLGKAGLSA